MGIGLGVGGYRARSRWVARRGGYRTRTGGYKARSIGQG